MAWRGISLLIWLVWIALSSRAWTDTVGLDSIGSTVYPRGGMAVIDTFSDYREDNFPRCAIANNAGSLAWVGLGPSSKSTIIELDLATLTMKRRLVYDQRAFLDAAINPTGTTGYFLSDFKLDVINLTSLSLARTVPSNAGERFKRLIHDPAGTFGTLVVERGTTQTLVRMDLSTFTRTAGLTLPASSFVWTQAIEPSGNYLYCVLSDGANASLLKIRLSDFQQVGRISIPPVSNMVFSNNGDALFGPLVYGSPGILRLNLSDFKTTASLPLPNGIIRIGNLSTDTNRTQAMAVAFDGSIVILDLGSFSFPAQLPAAPYLAGNSIPQTLSINPDKALVFCNTAPAVFELIGFNQQRKGPLLLEGGEYQFTNLLIEGDGRFGTLVGQSTFPNALRVDLNRFKRSHRTIFETVPRGIDCSASDGVNGFVSLASVDRDNPSTPIIKFDLTTLQEFGRQTLPARHLTAMAYGRYSNLLYCTYPWWGPSTAGALGVFNASTFSQFSSLLALTQLNDQIACLLPNPTAAEVFFSRYPANQVQKYNTSLVTGQTFTRAPSSLLRNPQTGNIYASIAELEQSNLFELNPNTFQTINQALILPTEPNRGSVTQGVLDPLNRFALYPTISHTLLMQKLNDFYYIDSLPLLINPEFIQINPTGTEAYIGQSNYFQKVALTPRGRMEASRFFLPTSARVSAFHFYSHAAIGPRQTEVLPLGRNLVNLNCGFIDRVHQRAWFGTQASPGQIIQFDTLTRDVVSTSVLRTGENDLTCGLCDSSGTYGYFATNTQPGKIIKVRLADGARFAVLTLNADEGYCSSGVIDPANGFAYFSTNSIPVRIIKIRLSDFTRNGAITLADDEGYLTGMAISPQNNFLYVPCSPFNAKILKIRVSDFTRIAAAPINSHYVNGMVIDPTGSFLYLAGGFISFGTPPPGQIERVRLSDFTAPGPNLTLSAEETAPGPIAMQSDGQALWFINNGTPPKLIRVDLPSFIRGPTSALGDRLGGTLTSLLLDQDASHGFSGIYSTPGRIVSLEPRPRPLRLALYQDFNTFKELLWQSPAVEVPQANDWVRVPADQGSRPNLLLNRGDYILAWQFDADEAGPSHTYGNSGDGLQLALPFGAFPSMLKRFDAKTSWTTTVSRWSAYMEYDNRNVTADWQAWN